MDHLTLSKVTATIMKRSSEHPSGCRIWRGRRSTPRIRVAGSFVSVRRLVYEICKGRIPDGANVLASCGNSRCVNPEHLFLKGDAPVDVLEQRQLNRIERQQRYYDRSTNERTLEQMVQGWTVDTAQAAGMSSVANAIASMLTSVEARLAAGERWRYIAGSLGVGTRLLKSAMKPYIGVTTCQDRPRNSVQA